MEVALFVPCYVDQLYPRVALATVEILERHGVKVAFPERQTCCGQPLANSGLFADAAPLVRKMAEVFEPYEYVVCPSGSCTSMVRRHGPEICPDDAAVKAVSRRTWELCEFLHDILRVKPEGRFPHKVGLHQSCHGLRELRLGSGSERLVTPFNKVRALLEPLEGISLVEVARPDDCCGFGGTFSVTHESISCAMGNDRLADHEKAGAEVITGTDVSCLMHLGGLIQRNGRRQRVMHVAEILAEAAA